MGTATRIFRRLWGVNLPVVTASPRLLILSGLSWDQAIIEFCPENSEDPFDGWIHLSSKRVKSENRGDVLRAVKNDGKTVYERLN